MTVADPRPRFPELLGGIVCLDFVNTVEERHGPRRQDLLASYEDLIGWARHAALLSDPAAARLRQVAAEHPEEAAAVLAAAIALREAIHRTFRAIAAAERPRAEDLGTLAAAYRGALSRAAVAPAGDGFAWVWDEDYGALDRPLWPVARSALELLTSGELRRVKECPDAAGCGWLFLDASRNSSRRWCSMTGCGSRAKMRRQYAKRRCEGKEPR